MPQMKPLNWLTLFMWNSIIMVMYLMYNHYYYKSNVSTMNNKKNHKKNFYFKW